MFINFYSLVPLFSIFQFIIIFHSTSAKNLLKEKKNLLSPKENLKTLNTVKDDQSLISVKRIPYDEVFVHSKIFQMAAAAYGSVDDFVKCLSTLSGSYDVYFNIQIPCFTNENCTGFMALSLADKALILSFGTSKYAYKKLLNDSGESIFSKRRKSPLGFGSGLVSDNLFSIFYQMQLAGITKKTYDMIKFFDGYDLWITGHSIGGAIASIAAAKIASANVIDARQVKLVTFGQPRVGNKAWAAAMENALPYYTYRIVNERDPVANLPHHSFMFYTHFGLEILYFANNSTTYSTSILENYKVCTSGEDKHCKNNNTNFNINDHINYYGTNVAEYGRNGCKKL